MGHLCTQAGWESFQEKKKEKWERTEHWKSGDGGWGVGGLGGEKEKRDIVVDKRAFELRTPRT